MTILTQKKIGLFVGSGIIISLFILTSVFAQKYNMFLQSYIQDSGFLGVTVYVMIAITTTVLAPLSSLPLLPIASQAWGWFAAGILSIIGWTIGAQIAYILAQKFGKPFIQKFISLEKIDSFESKIPETNLFWSIVLLRMTVPVDILSYAIGIFSKIKSVPYFWSTLIGVTPFAFVFSYVGTISIKYQIATLIIVGIILSLIFFKKK